MRSRSSSTQGFSLVELLLVVLVMGIVGAMAVPLTETTLDAYAFESDGNGVASMARLAKMRAATQSTRSRLRANLNAGTYRMEVWDRTAGTWVNETGDRFLSTDSTFGFGALGAPPPNTQVAIGFSVACTDDAGADIANTACITYNSRGIPVDAIGDPTGGNAIYMTNGVGVHAVTVTATPLVRLWWSPSTVVAWDQR